MKLTVKFLILTAVFVLAFTNRASADFTYDDKNFGSHWDHRYDYDKGDHHHHHHGSGGGGNIGHLDPAPEPVGTVLFLFGAGLLAVSYRQRRKLQTA